MEEVELQATSSVIAEIIYYQLLLSLDFATSYPPQCF